MDAASHNNAAVIGTPEQAKQQLNPLIQKRQRLEQIINIVRPSDALMSAQR
jgi:alkanesulfonate monooxygenase SsuD/methylene tetrahydromethanopterin reductase-like flavin-dependent oxidoreductase (luciferase family)